MKDKGIESFVAEHAAKLSFFSAQDDQKIIFSLLKHYSAKIIFIQRFYTNQTQTSA